MNELHRFLFDGLPVRGALVRLGPAWTELLARRAASEAGAWPMPVTVLLGEMAAAGVLMRASIKFDGALVLQIFGDGPVRLAVAEVGADLALRATAKVVGAVQPQDDLATLVNSAGRGRCAITLEPRQRQGGQQPYQGVVPLHGDRGEALRGIAPVLEHYMLQSEQLDTRLVLAADAQAAAGLLIQRMPTEGERNLGSTEAGIGRSEDFNRIATLAASLTPEELLGLDVDTVLHRLFWDEPLLRFEPAAVRFACRCTRERVAGMLRSLGQAEAQDIVAERGEIEVACDFCGQRYRFDAVDAAELFTPAQDHPPGSASLQ